MTDLNNILETGAGWLVTFLLPFALILTAVRLMLTPVWVNIEYRTPFFLKTRMDFPYLNV